MIQTLEYEGGFSSVFLVFSLFSEFKYPEVTLLLDSASKIISFWALLVKRKRMRGMMPDDRIRKAAIVQTKFIYKTKLLTSMVPLIERIRHARNVEKIPMNSIKKCN